MRRYSAAVAAALLLACTSSQPRRVAAEVPFQLTQDHVYVPVTIGNHAPSWFLLDTGAQITALAQTTADALGLIGHGRGQARGAGAALVETTVISDVDLELAGTPIHIPRLPGIPLTPVSLAEGRPIEGILGATVIRDLAIEIDYERRRLRLHDPSAYAAPPDAVVVPVTFYRDRPVVAAELTLADGRTLPMRMLVDTGARGILVNTPFAERHRIYDAIAPTIAAPFGVGIGGTTHQRVGRARRFTLAGFMFEAPIVNAAEDRAGATASAEIDGLIGSEVLRRFTLTLDYRQRRLLLAPNSALRDPFETEMLGAGFKAADLKFDRILVRYVLPNSPASEAGLQEGDEIVAVDGRAAAPLTVGGLRAHYLEPATRHVLRTRRGGREGEVAIVTRRLV
jgi:predicted aspartyl protease